MKSLVWFITGASRGFGLEIARAALERRDSVVAAARDPKVVEGALGQREQLMAVELDVTDERQAQSAVSAAFERFGQIDVLVNNAGRGLLGAVEEASAEEVRSVFAVNVDGLLNVTRMVLPSMRARRSGRILNLSAVGGFDAWPGWGVYCATKFAVEGLSEALRAELLPLGIHVTIIEPGTLRTDFLDASSLWRAARSSTTTAAAAAARDNGLTRRITINSAIRSKALPPSWRLPRAQNLLRACSWEPILLRGLKRNSLKWRRSSPPGERWRSPRTTTRPGLRHRYRRFD